MKPKIKRAHMKAALAYAECSTATRLNVGAIIVKEDAVISIGYNGMPPGWDNNCEDIVWDPGSGPYLDPEEFNRMYPFEKWHDGAQRIVRYGLRTKTDVIHAEANAIDKLAKASGGAKGASMFITHAPCLECAKRIFNVGIVGVFYGEKYRDEAGLDFLKKAGVEVEEVTITDV